MLVKSGSRTPARGRSKGEAQREFAQRSTRQRHAGTASDRADNSSAAACRAISTEL